MVEGFIHHRLITFSWFLLVSLITLARYYHHLNYFALLRVLHFIASAPELNHPVFRYLLRLHRKHVLFVSNWYSIVLNSTSTLIELGRFYISPFRECTQIILK